VIDIQSIDYPDDMFDVIICFHVLEHVTDDRKAVRELARILNNSGIAYIGVPIFNIDTTFEDPAHDTPELRLRHYGQTDHVRKYGKDFPGMLSEEGFNVKTIKVPEEFTNKEIFHYGLKGNEIFFECRVDLCLPI
jgi:ubiquinone/menaquinone biosynthesis C-methylase UbiE